MKLIFVLPCVHFWVPEEALDLWHYCAQSCEERSQNHFVAIAGVNWLASLRENHEVLPDLVELDHRLGDFDLSALRVDVLLPDECLEWVTLGNLFSLVCAIFSLLLLFGAWRRCFLDIWLPRLLFIATNWLIEFLLFLLSFGTLGLLCALKGWCFLFIHILLQSLPICLLLTFLGSIFMRNRITSILRFEGFFLHIYVFH